MKNKKLFFKQVGKRFFTLASLPVVGLLGASILFLCTLVLWLLGFIIIPIGLLQMKQTMKESSDKDEDPSLPAWAQWWDDSLDLDIRGRPQAPLVWNYGLSWFSATFVHLQFYNPLANLRTKVVDFRKLKTGR